MGERKEKENVFTSYEWIEWMEGKFVYTKWILWIKNNFIDLTTHSAADVALNGGVGTIGCIVGSTEPGGNVKFNLFFDILLIMNCLYLQIEMF